jgi:hypothetical protein
MACGAVVPKLAIAMKTLPQHDLELVKRRFVENTEKRLSDRLAEQRLGNAELGQFEQGVYRDVV